MWLGLGWAQYPTIVVVVSWPISGLTHPIDSVATASSTNGNQRQAFSVTTATATSSIGNINSSLNWAALQEVIEDLKHKNLKLERRNEELECLCATAVEQPVVVVVVPTQEDEENDNTSIGNRMDDN